MEEGADSKEAKRRRLLPCSSFTSDDDSLMETSDNVYEENEIAEKSARVDGSENKMIDPRVDADIQKVVSLIEKRKPLPPNYDNFLDPVDGNVAIRFDGLSPDAKFIDLCRMIPPALNIFVDAYQGVYFDGLNGNFGFVRFNCHEIAKNFLHSFNGKKFHNPDITYQLSWAPFKLYIPENVDVYEEKTICESNTEAKTELDTNSNSDSKADSEGDSEAESESDSEADSNTSSGTSGSDSESVREMKDEQIISRKETVEESQARKAMLMEEEKQYEDFYIRLDKEFHERNDLWPWPAPVTPYEVDKCFRGSPTSILYLYEVDPLFEKKDMERIFKKFGHCSVSLPQGKGMGYVEFVERESAVQAYKKLFYVMWRLGICHFSWGYKLSKDLNYMNMRLSVCPRDLMKFMQPVGDSKEDKPVGDSKEDESFGGTIDDESVKSSTDDESAYRDSESREKPMFLYCPILGAKCKYPHNKQGTLMLVFWTLLYM